VSEMHRRDRPQVVIAGGGFGGLQCARALDGASADVLLVDRNNYHLFTPLVYQVATALLNPSDIAYPFRKIFRRSRNVRFRQAAVETVDLSRSRLRTRDGAEIPYDILVLSTGAANDYFGDAALAENTIGMKTIAEAMRLRNHVLSCLERASQVRSEDERAAWMTFVIAGGGPTGVEYAGALAELLKIVLGRDFPDLPLERSRIVLVEGRGRLLPTFHPRLGAYAARILERRRVEVHTSTLVEMATDKLITLTGGVEIPARTVVWSAGVRPVAPAASEPVPLSPSRRIRVDDHMRLPGHPEVFVIGDVASVEDGGTELPMLSPPAMQAGRYVAKLIRDRLRGVNDEDHRPFHYVDKGMMATIGRGAAVAELHGIRIRGFLGWVAWLLVHVYHLVGFRNRAIVLASWGWDYLRRDRPIRVTVATQRDPIAESLLSGDGSSRSSMRAGHRSEVRHL
jgi:NADH:ubiquinone reductase (H+-translocating)